MSGGVGRAVMVVAVAAGAVAYGLLQVTDDGAGDGPRVVARARCCTAEQVYGLARQAGFAPGPAVTMTAVALAESGGNPQAHNPRGENSQGLWQINRDAHPEFTRVDLFDPAVNARAAFAVSSGGADVSPWTVTHGGSSARYLRHRQQAQHAATAHGEGAALGMWSGTTGYGDRR